MHQASETSVHVKLACYNNQMQLSSHFLQANATSKVQDIFNTLFFGSPFAIYGKYGEPMERTLFGNVKIYVHFICI